MSYTKDRASCMYLDEYEMPTMNELMKKIQEKWPGCSMDDIQISPTMEKIRGCGCHSEISDYECFLKIENTSLTAHFEDIENGLKAYWEEGGDKITADDLPDLAELASQLLYERGLNKYSEQMKISYNYGILSLGL